MKKNRKFIMLWVNRQKVIIKVSEITRLQTDAPYATIFLADGTKMQTGQSLALCMKEINNADFILMHQSNAINKNYMKIFVGVGEGGYAIMLNDDRIDLAKARKKHFCHSFANL